MVPYPFLDDLPPKLISAHNVSSVIWACVPEYDPLTIRVQYVHSDGTTRRIQVYRPWRTSEWMYDNIAITDVECVPKKNTPYEIALLSVQRQVDYFSDTMRQVRMRFPEVHTHVVTNVTASTYMKWVNVPNVSVHLVPIPQLSIKAKSILMYEYALSVSSSDILVIEDDVTVHPNANIRLNAMRYEILQKRKMFDFVLDCYVVSWQGQNRAKSLQHTFVETDYGCCTQCMYFSHNVTRSTRERMQLERTNRTSPDPYDFIIHNTASFYKFPIYGSVKALVQHRGMISTGLTGVKGLHQTVRY